MTVSGVRDDSHLWDELAAARASGDPVRIDRAKAAIYEHHEGYLGWFATRYKARRAPEEEYRAELRWALARAIEGYKPERGPFSSYLDLWCRKALYKTLGDHQPLTAVSGHVTNKILRVHKARSELGSDATVEEVAQLAGVKEGTVEAYEAIPEVLSLNYVDDSCDDEAVSESLAVDPGFEDQLVDHLSPEPEVLAVREAVAAVLSRPGVGPMQYDIVMSMMDPDGHSLAQIARHYGVHPETARRQAVVLRSLLREEVERRLGEGPDGQGVLDIAS